MLITISVILLYQCQSIDITKVTVSHYHHSAPNSLHHYPYFLSSQVIISSHFYSQGLFIGLQSRIKGLSSLFNIGIFLMLFHYILQNFIIFLLEYLFSILSNSIHIADYCMISPVLSMSLYVLICVCMHVYIHICIYRNIHISKLLLSIQMSLDIQIAFVA